MCVFCCKYFFKWGNIDPQVLLTHLLYFLLLPLYIINIIIPTVLDNFTIIVLVLQFNHLIHRIECKKTVSVCYFVEYRNKMHCVKHQNFTKFLSVEILWKLCRSCAFFQNFHTRKLGEISVFYAVMIIEIGRSSLSEVF